MKCQRIYIYFKRRIHVDSQMLAKTKATIRQLMNRDGIDNRTLINVVVVVVIVNIVVVVRRINTKYEKYTPISIGITFEIAKAQIRPRGEM